MLLKARRKGGLKRSDRPMKEPLFLWVGFCSAVFQFVLAVIYASGLIAKTAYLLTAAMLLIVSCSAFCFLFFQVSGKQFPLSSRSKEALSLIDRPTRKEISEHLDTMSNLISLQSQIHPHFLYNTLDSLRGELYVQSLPQLAETVECLSDLFRYSINQSNNLISLKFELDNTFKYLKIMQFRFPNKFNIVQTYDPDDIHLLNLKVPRLMLQPIVENSIIHGLEDKVGPGTIELSILYSDRTLQITISDDGLGFPPKALESINQKLSSNVNPVTEGSSSRVALLNINSRIKLLFGSDYGISILSKPNFGTQVQIMLPYSGEKE